MSPRRRPHVCWYERNRIRRAVGLEAEPRANSWSSWGPCPDYVIPFAEWNDKRKPSTDLCNRVFAAFLFVRDIPLAVKIANRCKTLEEAGAEARAMAAIKELADVQTDE